MRFLLQSPAACTDGNNYRLICYSFHQWNDSLFKTLLSNPIIPGHENFSELMKTWYTSPDTEAVQREHKKERSLYIS